MALVLLGSREAEPRGGWGQGRLQLWAEGASGVGQWAELQGCTDSGYPGGLGGALGCRTGGHAVGLRAGVGLEQACSLGDCSAHVNACPTPARAAWPRPCRAPLGSVCPQPPACRPRRSEFTDTILSVHPSDVLDMPVDPNEPTYCLCHQVSYGEMIGCDNPDVSMGWAGPGWAAGGRAALTASSVRECGPQARWVGGGWAALTACSLSLQCPIEWFHFACVDLTTKPTGKWSVWRQPCLWAGRGGLPAAPVLVPGAELQRHSCLPYPGLWLSSPLCDSDLESHGFVPLPRGCFSVVNTTVPRAPWWAEPADAEPGCEEPWVGTAAGALTPALCKVGLPPTAAALALEGDRGDCRSRQGRKDSPWGSSDGS